MTACGIHRTMVKIWPLTYGCKRDWDLFRLSRWTALRTGAILEPWVFCHDANDPLTPEQTDWIKAERVVAYVRPPWFAPWCGWNHGMSKIKGLIELAGNPLLDDQDFLIHTDSDILWFAPDLFNRLRSEKADYLGIEHTDKFPPFIVQRPWAWISGSLQIVRVSTVRRLAVRSAEVDRQVRHYLNHHRLPHMEDVMLTAFVEAVGTERVALDPGEYCESDPMAAIRGKAGAKSFTHYQAPDKWHVTRQLKEAGAIPESV